MMGAPMAESYRAGHVMCFDLSGGYIGSCMNSCFEIINSLNLYFMHL